LGQHLLELHDRVTGHIDSVRKSIADLAAGSATITSPAGRDGAGPVRKKLVACTREQIEAWRREAGIRTSEGDARR